MPTLYRDPTFRHFQPPEDTQTCTKCDAPVLDTDVPPGYEPICFNCQQIIEEEAA